MINIFSKKNFIHNLKKNKEKIEVPFISKIKKKNFLTNLKINNNNYSKYTKIQIENQNFSYEKNFLKFSKKFEIKKNRSFVNCNIMPRLEKFYLNILEENLPELQSLLKNSNFPFHYDFLLLCYLLNKDIFNDIKIEEYLNKIILNEQNLFNNISNKEQILNLCSIFSENFNRSSNDPIRENLLKMLKKYSYMMDKSELMEIYDILTVSDINREKDRKNSYLNQLNNLEDPFDENESFKEENIFEKYVDEENPKDPVGKEMLKRQIKKEENTLKFFEEENINFFETNEQKTKVFIKANELNFDKNFLKFSVNLEKNKASLKSLFFKPKIIICAFDDHLIDNVLPVLEIIRKYPSNCILFDERPVGNLLEGKFVGIFDYKMTKKYYNDFMKNNEDLNLKNIEKIVWENIDDFRTASYIKTIFLRAFEYKNKDLKLIFADIPEIKEIEYLLKNFFKKEKNQKEKEKRSKKQIKPNTLEKYLILSSLLEKVIWLRDTCRGECPKCNKKLRFESAYEKNKKILENFLINLKDNIKVRNLSEKIIHAADIFEEKEILVFVKEKNFVNLVNQLIKDLSDFEKDEDLLKDENLMRKIILENLQEKNSDLNMKENNEDDLEIKENMENYEDNDYDISEKEIFDWGNDFEYIEEMLENDREYAVDKIGFLLAAYYPNENELESLDNVNFMSNDDLRNEILKKYKSHLTILNQTENLEGWKKVKYEKRCYPYKKLVDELI